MSEPAPVDPRVSRTVAKVRRAVNDLIAAEGVGAVTFGRISRASGVSRTTLYRHWDRPADLIDDVWSQVAPSNVVAHTDALADDLVTLFLAVRDVVESPTMRRALPSLLAAAADDDAVAELHARFVAERRAPIVARLDAAVAAGDVVADADLELVVDLLSGPIFYRQLLRRTDTSDADVRAVVATVLAAVTAPRGA